ncbi:hypothetical protein [Nonlabens xylanidelens]|uniref:hypothetical protein n=1 Tax=Nonlabens xylanidelens TaxID=191564 RepID=UPI001473C775|nr:hypothetical protein [Nonlabens xylanidelens]
MFLITDEDGNAQDGNNRCKWSLYSNSSSCRCATVDIDETTLQQEQFKQKEQTQQR